MILNKIKNKLDKLGINMQFKELHFIINLKILYSELINFIIFFVLYFIFNFNFIENFQYFFIVNFINLKIINLFSLF